MYRPATLRVFTGWCNQSPEFLSFKTETTLNTPRPYLSALHRIPSLTTILSVSVNLAWIGLSWKGNHIVFVSLWLECFTVKFSRFIYVVTCFRISFLFKAGYYSIVCTYCILSLILCRLLGFQPAWLPVNGTCADIFDKIMRMESQLLRLCLGAVLILIS